MTHRALTRHRGILVAMAACVVVGAAAVAASGRPADTVKIGAALLGPKNDKSFNQGAYDGIQRILQQFPNTQLTSVLENQVTPGQRTSAIDTLGPLDNIVVGVSAAFGPVFDTEAAKFPNTSFVTTFGAPSHFHPNVYSFVPERGYPAYVAGVLAAYLTKTKIVGFVGGADIPPTEQSLMGFIAGVRHVNKRITVLKNIVGDFNDVEKAKAATAAMLSDNADVIMPYLDAGIAGAYAAGVASGKNPPMFKIDIPDCTSYPNIIGSDVGNNTNGTYNILKGLLNKTLSPPGVAVFVGLQDANLQSISLCPQYRSNPKLFKIWRQTIKDINTGKIKLPKVAQYPRPPYPWRETFKGPVQNAGQTG